MGKILKKEKRSGAPLEERTVRDEEIMSTWAFLVTHIAKGATYSSEEVITFYFKLFFGNLNSFAYIITNKNQCKCVFI